MFEIQLTDGTAIFAMKAMRENDESKGLSLLGKTVRVVPGPKGGPTLMPWSTKSVFISDSLIALIAELENDAPHVQQVRSMLTGVALATSLPRSSPGTGPEFTLVEG
jgi:hypothetical protein